MLYTLSGGDFVWALAGMLGSFKDPAVLRWNERELPQLMEQWQRSTVCMRCGEVADPANVVLGVRYAAGGRPGSA